MSRPRDLLAVLRFLWDHADQLKLLFERLPPTLRAAGEGLESAGNGAVLAGRAIGGDAAAPASAAAVLRQATGALEQVHFQMQAMAGELRGAADALDQIRLPVVTAVKQRFNLRAVGLGEPEFVTGINIGEQRPPVIGTVAGRLRSQAELLDARLGGELRTAADRLGRMSESLDSSGRNLHSLGDALKTVGTALQQFGS